MYFHSKSKSHYDRQSVGQSVLVSGTHLGPATNFTFSFIFFLRQLWVCNFVAPSLTRGRVSNFLNNCFWAFPEQSLFVEVLQNSRPYFTVSSGTPPTWRARSGIYIPQERSISIVWKNYAITKLHEIPWTAYSAY
jgi:hypothetical protein